MEGEGRSERGKKTTQVNTNRKSMAELQETVWFQSFVEHRDAARVITCCTVVVVCLESFKDQSVFKRI